MVRWLHISDLHFGYDSNAAKNMREHLVKLAARIGHIDFLFITGDLRYGKASGDDFPKETLSYIEQWQKAFNLSKNDTFIVEGNHDINRDEDHFELIRNLRRKYDKDNGVISKYTLGNIRNMSQPFFRLREAACGREEQDFHYVANRKDKGVDIICLNTAMTSCGDGEDGSLILGSDLIDEMFQSVKGERPVIVLAHHKLHQLNQYDRTHFINKLRDAVKGNVLYLCGHTHYVEVDDAYKKGEENSRIITFTCGTNMDADKKESMDVLVGELNPETMRGYVQAYQWSTRIDDWLPDQEFSYQQDSALDGRWYFPSRPDNKKPATALARAYFNCIRERCGEVGIDSRSDRSVPQDIKKLFVGLDLFDFKRAGIPTLQALLKHNRNHPSSNMHGSISAPLVSVRDVPPKSEDESTHCLIFSNAGGGKSTLLKWMACAYAFPDVYKMDKNASGLPELGTLFPVWISCRTARGNTLLDAIRESLPDADRERVYAFVRNRIKNGNVLLLLDGIDEAGSAALGKWAVMLSDFLKQFPNVRTIVTFRESGFAAMEENPGIFEDFRCFEIAPLNREQILEFQEKWWRVNGGITDADAPVRLAASQIENDASLYAVAVSPLLLTNLLIVQSRYRRLPRCLPALYQSTLDAILERRTVSDDDMTPDEMVRQLSLIAYEMTLRKQDSLTEAELRLLLADMRAARSDLILPRQEEALLRAVKTDGMILCRTFAGEGEDAEHTLFQFSVKVFQEYLTAFAAANGYYLNYREDDAPGGALLDIRAAEELSERSEMLPLTAVMSIPCGRRLARLAYARMKQENLPFSQKRPFRNLLLSLLGAGTLLDAETVAKILRVCFGNGMTQSDKSALGNILRSRYCDQLEEFLRECGEREFGDPEYWMGLVKLLSGDVRTPYLDFTRRQNLPDEAFAEALAVLDESIWMGGDPRYAVADLAFLWDDTEEARAKKRKLAADMLQIAATNGNASVCRQSLRVLRDLFPSDMEFHSNMKRCQTILPPELSPVYPDALVRLINLSATAGKMLDIPPVEFYALTYAVRNGNLNLRGEGFANGALEALFSGAVRKIPRSGKQTFRYREVVSLLLLTALFPSGEAYVGETFAILGTMRDKIWREEPTYSRFLLHYFELVDVLYVARERGDVSDSVWHTVRDCLCKEDFAILTEYAREDAAKNKRFRRRMEGATSYYVRAYPDFAQEDGMVDWAKLREHLEA